jgi:hypothetical protein
MNTKIKHYAEKSNQRSEKTTLNPFFEVADTDLLSKFILNQFQNELSVLKVRIPKIEFLILRVSLFFLEGIPSNSPMLVMKVFWQ